MIQRNMCYLVLSVAAIVVLTGCMPKLTIEEMKAMMPERPAALDKLDAFVGNWEMEGETRITGLEDALETTGSAETEWAGDGWYIVSRNSFTMGELGEMQGQETWTYDTHSKKYRSTWVDSTGSTGTGEARHDDKTNTWYFHGSTYGPFGKVSWKGQAKVIDEDTWEWTYAEYAGLMKTMEMTGTSRRR